MPTSAAGEARCQDAPRVTMSSARPTISSADGRSSIALRSVVQLDAAHYGEDADGGATDFRRGSVGATANRETAAARDFSDGAYFRRARFGFEGTVARDFTYRVLAELGGSGTEGPARINDFWIGYTGFAPFTIQVGAFSPPANMDDGINVESSLFIERAAPSELSRTLGGADGRIGLGVRGNGARWMSALTLTTRTVNDAEVFDSQLAAVGRFGTLLATSADYNIHAGLSGTWVFQPPDQGSTAAAAQRHVVRLARPAGDPRRQHAAGRHRLDRRRFGIRLRARGRARTGRTGTCRPKVSATASNAPLRPRRCRTRRSKASTCRAAGY